MMSRLGFIEDWVGDRVQYIGVPKARAIQTRKALVIRLCRVVTKSLEDL